MKLIRLLIGLALLAGLGYVAVEVPLGEKTLVQHVRAIAGTEEGQELVEGVKQKAVEVKDRATGAAEDEAGSGDGGGKASAGDDLTDKERKLLRKLIKDKLKDAAKGRAGLGQGDADPSSKDPPKK